MQKQLLPEAEGYAKNNVRRRIWRRFVRVMACVVVFCTTYALILPAITMERNGVCELEEHTHTDNCYSQLTSREMVSLRCTHDTLQIHSHTQACYGADGQLVCGLADFVVHEHNGSCLDAEGNLVCTLPVIRVHEHTDACYLPEETTADAVHEHDESCYTQERGELLCQLDTVEPHVHTDACGGEKVLSCGMEEAEAHSHTEECENKVLTCEATVEPHIHGEGCYVQLVCELAEDENHTHSEACSGKVLSCDLTEQPHVHGEGCYQVEYLCGLTEGPGHVHDDTCYCVVYNCGLEEGTVHEHDDSCYEMEEVLICEAELTGSETEPTTAPEETERELICQEQEIILHSHTDACYEIHTDGEGNEVRTLICESLEVREHIHGEGCFVTEEVPVDTEALTCTLPALHSHSEACYDEAGVLICTESTEAHSHGEACYDEAGALICTEPTEGHVHGTMCYGTWVLTCGLEEHTHTEECLVEPEYYCGVEEHDHTEACTNEAGELICGQEEHIHTEECLLPTYYCGLEEHIHNEECMDTDGNLVCEIGEHVHSEECTEKVKYYCGQEEHTHTEECTDADGSLICNSGDHIHDENCKDPLLHLDMLIFPECDCENGLLDLAEHADECIRRIYCLRIVGAYSVTDLYFDWGKFDNDVQKFILDFLSDEYPQQYSQLDQLLNGDPDKFVLADGMIVMVDGIPEGGRLYVTDVETGDQTEVLDAISGISAKDNATIHQTKSLVIKVLLDGVEWQPEDGNYVTVTVSGIGINKLASDRVAIDHIYDDEVGIYNAFERGCVLSYTTGGLSTVYPDETDAVEAVMGQQDTIYFEEFYHDGDQMVINEDGSLSFNLYSFSTVQITGYSVSNPSSIPGAASLPDAVTGITVDKYVEHIDGKNYLLTLEAYSRGYTEFTPPDVAFIIDQSCSMYSPVEPDAELKSDSTGNVDYSIMTYEQLMNLDMSNPANAKAGMEGYYVAVFRKTGAAANEYYAIPLKYDGGWKRTQGDGSVAYNKWVSQTITEIWNNQWMDLGPTWENNEPFTIYKSVYGAAYDAMETFANEMARGDVQDCYASIVAFSCPSQSYSAGPMNTGVFVNGTLIEGVGDGISVDTYQNSFNNMATPDGIAAFRNSVNAIRTSGQTTTTDAGFDLANRALYNWNPTPGTERQKIVILFTDGVPENRISTGFSDNYTPAIQTAKYTKEMASVYAFGPTAGGQPLDFLMALSSSYPDATSLSNMGGYSGTQYYGTASSSTDLQRVFGAIAKEITQSSAKLDGSAQLRDIITDEFVLPVGTVPADIKVYTAPWNGSTFGNLVSADMTVTISGQTVNVSGYNYSAEENWVIDGRAGGNKLVVKIPITVSPDFHGGNHVQTNTADTAIYANDGTPEVYFPLPYVDVPTDVVVKKIVVANASERDSRVFDFNSVFAKWNGYKNVEGVVAGDSNYLQTIQKSVSTDYQLAHEETEVLEDVHVGSTLTVTESPAPGYSTSVEVNGQVIYPDEDGKITLTVTPGMQIVYINTAGYELPSTGGAGTHLYTMGGLLLMTAAAVLLYIHNLKRRKEDLSSFCGTKSLQ